ncbi:TIGR04438 family Trp-rich protein [Caldimonas tepidiphila]|uniref:TIGR04438 family Trp-rich protein n=1 Tax=Caldimonas tepidiphila TaxID=2315841 RepID=UPI000E5AA025|nr:TIGR04438 family Trp-rich protein [Caldimonas tepidiphila]
MYLVLLGIVALILKVAEIGPVAQWSWFLVLSPFAGAVAWWSWADASGYNQRQQMKRMEERKKDRQRKSLEALGQPTRKR